MPIMANPLWVTQQQYPAHPWPDATNTGYRNAPGYPGTLATFSGTVTSNTTYNFQWFSGGGNVGAFGANVSNVTFNGCRFTDVGTSSAPAFVFANNGITFNYCSFEPEPLFLPYQPPVSFANGYQIGISADGAFNTNCGGLLVQYCDLWGFAGGIDVQGSTQANPQIFQHNWIHDARQDGGIDHTDGLGATSGSAVSTYAVVHHNSIQSAANTNGLAFQRNGTYDHMTITGNLFGGFGYTVAVDAGTGTANGVTFTDNVFTTAILPGFGPLYPSSVVWWTGLGGLWRRNTWLVPAGAAWGVPAHSGLYWLPVANTIVGTDDTQYVSATDYTG